MITSVALNPALDVTYLVDHLSHCTPVRVREVRERAGGKAVNVARVLAALACDVFVTGLAGGAVGAEITNELEREGIATRFHEIAGETRRTVVANARDGSFAEYDEPGALVTSEEWAGFLESWPELIGGCEWVVLAGSIPPGLPTGAYATLVERAHGHGARAFLDTAGPPLSAALAAAPDVVKLNRSELEAHVGYELGDESAVIAALDTLLRHAASVIVTLGPDGAIARSATEGLRLRQPPRTGSPVGAGDAFTAGLLACDERLERRLPFAAALAASAVGQATAGVVDIELARSLATEVEVLPL